MKITKTQLRNIVQEELTGLLKEVLTLNEFTSSDLVGQEVDIGAGYTFAGAGGYIYTLTDTGDWAYEGPDGQTGTAKRGSAAHASIEAEDTTGQSHYQAPAPAVDHSGQWTAVEPSPLAAGPGPATYYGQHGQALPMSAAEMAYGSLVHPNRAPAFDPAAGPLPGLSNVPPETPYVNVAQWAGDPLGAEALSYAAAQPDTPEYFKKGQLRKLARHTRAAKGKPAGLGRAGRQELRKTFANAPQNPDAPRQRDIGYDDLERIRTARDK